MPPPGGHVRRAMSDSHTVPVVTAARRLDDERPTDRGAELLQLGFVLDAGPRGARNTHRGQALAHGELVLRVEQGARRGLNGDEARSLLHGGRWNVLMLEGEDVRAVDERADRIQVSGSPSRLINRHLPGRPVVGLDKCAQVDSERNRALLHHPCQLSAANDGNGGRCAHLVFHSLNLSRR